MKSLFCSFIMFASFLALPAYASNVPLEVDGSANACEISQQGRTFHVKCSSGYYLVYWSGSDSSTGTFDKQENSRVHVAPDGVTKVAIIPYQ